jgi:hypothetical protein
MRDPDWGIIAPVGSARRVALVGDAVEHWKVKNDPKLRPESALKEIVKRNPQARYNWGLTLSKEARAELLKYAENEMHGALSSDIISSGSYYYLLSHEAWRLWLESFKGGKNGKRRKPPVQFAEDVLERNADIIAARQAAMIGTPMYSNDKEGYRGKSAVERAQMRLGEIGADLDTGEAGRVMKRAISEWAGNLGMAKDYTPEMAVDNAMQNRPQNLRERKEAAGKR